MSSKRRASRKVATGNKHQIVPPATTGDDTGTTEEYLKVPSLFERNSDSDDSVNGVTSSASPAKPAADDESSDFEVVDSIFVDTIADDGESTASSDDLGAPPAPPPIGHGAHPKYHGDAHGGAGDDDGGPRTVSSTTVPAKRPSSPAPGSNPKKIKVNGGLDKTHHDSRAGLDTESGPERGAAARMLSPAIELPASDGTDAAVKLQTVKAASTTSMASPGLPKIDGVVTERVPRKRQKVEPVAPVLQSFDTHVVDEDDSSWKTVTSYEVPPTVIPGTDQTQLDNFVDGEKILEGSIDSSLWDRSLHDMYMDYLPKAPQVNVGYGGHAQQQLDGPRFDEWVHLKAMVPFLRKVLKFDNNPFYINPSRASPLLFDVYDPSESGPYRNDQYLSLRYTTNPAVCISLVQVRLSRLYTPEVFLKYGTTDQHFDKKTIVANLFPQEQNFWNSNIGAVFDVPNIVLPIWPITDTPMALSFQTRPTKKMNVPTSWGGSGKRGGNYKENLTPSAKKTQGAVSLWANTTIPLFDGRKHILDLSKPLYDLGLPVLTFDPPRESLGVLFYTITESRKLIPEISLNVMGFVLLATPDDLAAARRST